MITLHGIPSGKFSVIIGEATREKKPFYDRSKYILVTDHLSADSLGYKGCITTGSKGMFLFPDHIYEVKDIDKITNGDILSINGDGIINIVWEIKSHQNALFLTENCNCRCVMCPQPPKVGDDSHYLKEANEILGLLKGKKLSDICITGGEPTETGDAFIRILKRCTEEHPEAHIAILSNGKNFANKEYIKKLCGLTTKNITFCISFHSEIDTLFDKISGRKGSFIQTQEGIYNLASLGFAIEIRHVISKLNYKHLKLFAEHIYNYFPFCCHYAFMGMELHGLAEKNYDIVHIFPLEHKEELKTAILSLARRCLPVSVYNIPHCCLAPEIRQYARQSISGWKNIYLSQCEKCSKRNECAGFFATSAILPVSDIFPI